MFLTDEIIETIEQVRHEWDEDTLPSIESRSRNKVCVVVFGTEVIGRYHGAGAEWIAGVVYREVLAFVDDKEDSLVMLQEDVRSALAQCESDFKFCAMKEMEPSDVLKEDYKKLGEYKFLIDGAIHARTEYRLWLAEAARALIRIGAEVFPEHFSSPLADTVGRTGDVAHQDKYIEMIAAVKNAHRDILAISGKYQEIPF